MLLPDLDTEESKAAVCQGLPAAEERCVSLPLPHADLCARLIFELDLMAAAELSQVPTPRSEVRSESDARSEPEPEEDEEGEARSEGDRRPTAEERRAARDALLTLYARGLPPLLAAVEAAGKTAPPFYWTPKADFCLACAGFAEDFILPSLQALPSQAAVSVRLLQLLAEASLADKKVEAGAAHKRQEEWLDHLERARAVAEAPAGMLVHGVRPPLRTSNDIRRAEHAAGESSLAREHSVAAAKERAWSEAAVAARASARSAEAAIAAYRYPAVGSRVVVQSRRKFLAPETWEGIVVRHARSQDAVAVQMASGQVRLISLTHGGDNRIVEVATNAH